MIDGTAIPDNCIRVDDNATEVMDAESLPDLRLGWDGDSSDDLSKALNEETDWLRRNTTFVEPVENAVDEDGMKSLEKRPRTRLRTLSPSSRKRATSACRDRQNRICVVDWMPSPSCLHLEENDSCRVMMTSASVREVLIMRV